MKKLLFGMIVLSLSILVQEQRIFAETETTCPATTVEATTTEVVSSTALAKTGTKKSIRKKKKKKRSYNKVRKLQLNQKKIRLNKGDRRYLKVSVKYKGRKKKNEPIRWKSTRPSVVKVNKNGVVYGKKKGTAVIKATSKYTKKTVTCKVTVGPTKYIAITFDDGPGKSTPRLLKALNKYDSKATFLLVGQYAAMHPSTVKKEFRSGMQIGNHTWSHANLNAVSTGEIRYQIKKGEQTIQGIIGEKPSIFRPPYGNYNPTVSKTVSVPMIYWSVDTLDWKYRNVNYVCRTILKNAYDGAIVLLHDSHPTTVNGFIKAQPKLIKRHYELVTVKELFRIKKKSLKKGIMYYGVQ